MLSDVPSTSDNTGPHRDLTHTRDNSCANRVHNALNARTQLSCNFFVAVGKGNPQPQKPNFPPFRRRNGSDTVEERLEERPSNARARG
jgi:hypothetical protein